LPDYTALQFYPEKVEHRIPEGTQTLSANILHLMNTFLVDNEPVPRNRVTLKEKGLRGALLSVIKNLLTQLNLM
jgi:hypothetical protein